MKIPVAGMDPSLTNWGIAESELDLSTGFLSYDPRIEVTQPDDSMGKQIRVNSRDLRRASQLAQTAFKVAKRNKVIFVEVPVGSQSARAMASYGICVGILASLRDQGYQIIEVTAYDVKTCMAGTKTATKRQMIDAAYKMYPNSNWLVSKGKLIDKNEHMADAIGAIHAGANTEAFKNLMRILG